LTWCDAHEAAKSTQQICDAGFHGIGKLSKIGWNIGPFFNFAAHAPHPFRLRIARRLPRAAAQAGAKSGVLGGLGDGEK
jgi:hypothetical protein